MGRFECNNFKGGLALEFGDRNSPEKATLDEVATLKANDAGEGTQAANDDRTPSWLARSKNFLRDDRERTVQIISKIRLDEVGYK